MRSPFPCSAGSASAWWAAARREQEERFYGSDAWRLGPREAIVSRIDGSYTVVIDFTEQAAAALQQE